MLVRECHNHWGRNTHHKPAVFVEGHHGFRCKHCQKCEFFSRHPRWGTNRIWIKHEDMYLQMCTRSCKQLGLIMWQTSWWVIIPKSYFAWVADIPSGWFFSGSLIDHQHIEWGYNLRQPCFKQQKLPSPQPIHHVAMPLITWRWRCLSWMEGLFKKKYLPDKMV